MNITFRYRKHIIRILILTLTVLLSLNVLPHNVKASWKDVYQSGDATFETIPNDNKIRATLAFSLFNLDPDTIFMGYYHSWIVLIPSEAKNITIFDQTSKLNFDSITDNYWTILTVKLRQALYFGGKYSFTITYDIYVPNGNQAIFTAWVPDGLWSTAIVVPKDFYNDFSLTPKAAAAEMLGSKTYYRYFSSSIKYIVVECAHRGIPVEKTATIKLKERTVKLQVSLWEGEEKTALRIVELYSAALPELENIIGVPFPLDSVILTEGTNAELKGYAGRYSQREGIKILWSEKTDSTLLHELAHYWTNGKYWSETWMREGHAEFYAYLVSIRLGMMEVGKKIYDANQQDYEKGKNTLDLPLIQWSLPEFYTGQQNVDFGYGKSFVFMFNLYGQIGEQAMQKTNKVVYAQGSASNWLDYFDILTTKTGQELQTLFTNWIIPPSLDSVLLRYRDTKGLLASVKDQLGLDTIKMKVEEARAYIIKGNTDQATNILLLTISTFIEWETALQRYREIETTISQESDTLGIQQVRDNLTKSKVFLLNGSYSEAATQANYSKILYNEWKSALSSYRNAESTVRSEHETLGAGFIYRQLSVASELLSRGQYSDAILQSNSTLSILPQWKDATKTFRNAERIIARETNILGRQTVENKMDETKQLIEHGLYPQVNTTIDLTLKLFSEWQGALTAVRIAEDTTTDAINDGRTWQIQKIQYRLELVRGLISDGQFEKSIPESQAISEAATNNMTPLRALLPYILSITGAVGILISIILTIRKGKQHNHDMI